ncbi:hypothetical protein KY290_035786 [Solanum tuberosum]|uniref:Uncharacterized protein n=1 Tax=Solanum tuberosum TaxID=4113 RepID=A0ABQ7TR16_SOLTU|nr:hypothetical protein KY284_035151 [Solanum tuberosum]KAH0737081.1 hypothetical protein KY290_035786 [Solanum tuberosum]
MASGVESFPAVDAEKELNPQNNKEFQVDSVSSQVASSLEKEWFCESSVFQTQCKGKGKIGENEK